MAGIFTDIKATLALNGLDGTEYVISVPGYFGVVQRQAILDSAEIAGIKISRLYNESSANIMNYGIFRKADLSQDTPRLVGFVDPGYGKTSFYVS